MIENGEIKLDQEPKPVEPKLYLLVFECSSPMSLVTERYPGHTIAYDFEEAKANVLGFMRDKKPEIYNKAKFNGGGWKCVVSYELSTQYLEQAFKAKGDQQRKLGKLGTKIVKNSLMKEILARRDPEMFRKNLHKLTPDEIELLRDRLNIND